MLLQFGEEFLGALLVLDKEIQYLNHILGFGLRDLVLEELFGCCEDRLQYLGLVGRDDEQPLELLERHVGHEQYDALLNQSIQDVTPETRLNEAEEHLRQLLDVEKLHDVVKVPLDGLNDHLAILQCIIHHV